MRLSFTRLELVTPPIPRLEDLNEGEHFGGSIHIAPSISPCRRHLFVAFLSGCIRPGHGRYFNAIKSHGVDQALIQMLGDLSARATDSRRVASRRPTTRVVFVFFSRISKEAGQQEWSNRCPQG